MGNVNTHSVHDIVGPAMRRNINNLDNLLSAVATAVDRDREDKTGVPGVLADDPAFAELTRAEAEDHYVRKCVLYGTDEDYCPSDVSELAWICMVVHHAVENNMPAGAVNMQAEPKFSVSRVVATAAREAFFKGDATRASALEEEYTMLSRNARRLPQRLCGLETREDMARFCWPAASHIAKCFKNQASAVTYVHGVDTKTDAKGRCYPSMAPSHWVCNLHRMMRRPPPTDDHIGDPETSTLEAMFDLGHIERQINTLCHFLGYGSNVVEVQKYAYRAAELMHENRVKLLEDTGSVEKFVKAYPNWPRVVCCYRYNVALISVYLVSIYLRSIGYYQAFPYNNDIGRVCLLAGGFWNEITMANAVEIGQRLICYQMNKDGGEEGAQKKSSGTNSAKDGDNGESKNNSQENTANDSAGGAGADANVSWMATTVMAEFDIPLVAHTAGMRPGIAPTWSDLRNVITNDEDRLALINSRCYNVYDVTFPILLTMLRHGVKAAVESSLPVADECDLVHSTPKKEVEKKPSASKSTKSKLRINDEDDEPCLMDDANGGGDRSTYGALGRALAMRAGRLHAARKTSGDHEEERQRYFINPIQICSADGPVPVAMIHIVNMLFDKRVDQYTQNSIVFFDDEQEECEGDECEAPED